MKEVGVEKWVCRLLLWVSFGALECVSAANIFCIFAAPSYSRQQPMLALSHSLAAAGHNLTVITTIPSKVPIKNHREIDISFLFEKYVAMQSASGFSLQQKNGPIELLDSLPVGFAFVSETILASSPVQQLIQELREGHTKYDLILYEAVYHSALLGFVELLGNPPVIDVVTMSIPSDTSFRMGNPLIPSHVPSMLLPYDHQMTFWQRIYNLFITIYIQYTIIIRVQSQQQKIMEKYFGRLNNTVYDLESNKSIILVSCDLATDYPKPVNPNTVHVGPLRLPLTETLPQDVKEWMDGAKGGVIYFSLGSNMQGTSLPAHHRNAFIQAFSQLTDVRVLWKWEADIPLPGRPDNVLVKKWFPQRAVLAHPNMKLFITQMGLQSLQESIMHNVPVLGVPLFVDQAFNGKKMLQSGSGLMIEFEQITSHTVLDAIHQILTNESYKLNMRRLSLISSDTPMSAIDTAVWWVEYVLRHKGASHLRPSSLDLTWYQYYMVDVFLFFVVIIFIVYHFTCKLISTLKSRPTVTHHKIKSS